MTKPYAIHRAEDPGIGPELYDAETDRDIAYVYPGVNAEFFARQFAAMPVLIDAACRFFNQTVHIPGIEVERLRFIEAINQAITAPKP